MKSRTAKGSAAETITTPLFPDPSTRGEAEALIAVSTLLAPQACKAIVLIILEARVVDPVHRQQSHPRPATEWRAPTRHLRRALAALDDYIAAVPTGATLHDLTRARDLMAAELAIITAARGSAFHGLAKRPEGAPPTPPHIVEALTVLRGFLPADAALTDRDARTVLHAAGLDVYLTT